MWTYYRLPHLRPQDPAPSLVKVGTMQTFIFESSFAPSFEVGGVLAEALDVHEATGLTPSQLQARVADLEAALRVAAESIIKLESIATESGAEAYDIACEEMEAWQAKRRKDGKEVGAQGSLVDGLAWVYERLDDLESGQ